MQVLGICAGNGVILHPFKKYLIGNIEPRGIYHTAKEEQWKANFGNIPLWKDESYENSYLEPDIIIGNPDCGHSSILALSRAKKFSDPKDNPSLTLFLKLVGYYNPSIFLMENLPKLLEQYPREELRDLFPNHHILFHTKSVWAWGNSQKNRKRLVMVGIKKKMKGMRKYLRNVYTVAEHKTCGELLKNLPQNGNVREPLTDLITLYAGFKVNLKAIKELWDFNPREKRWKVYNRKFDTAPGVYKNLFNDYPATARKANRQFNHESLQMTPRELARIQGIPDHFVIYINQDNIKYWINKGRTTVTKTPPYEISLWFYKQVLKIFRHGNK